MTKKWVTKGFDGFSSGEFGNGRQNIYVSKKGILQRVYHYDVNKDGYFDLLFSNGQDMNERVPVYIYQKGETGYTRKELPTHGAYSAAVADLSDSGHLDLIIVNQNDGATSEVRAQVYPGCKDGISGKYSFELPAPDGRSVAAGDFNGDGKKELVFYSDGKLRLFFQNENGFTPRQTKVLLIDNVVAVCADDIDGDGFCDLYVRIAGESPRVFWGSAGGLDLSCSSTIGPAEPFSHDTIGTTLDRPSYYWGWTPKVIKTGLDKLIFRAEEDKAVFYHNEHRKLIPVFSLDCQGIVSVECTDIDKDGWPDIVALVCTDVGKEEDSVIFWGSECGYSLDNTTKLKTQSARDAVVFEDNGTHIAICQGKTDILLSTHSLIYRLTGRSISDCTQLETHDATRVFAVDTGISKPQLIFINHEGGRTRADINAYLYYGGPDGYKPERRANLPVMSATDCNCCDFNDDGWADILLCNSADASYHLDPGSFIYYGGPSGFDFKKRSVLPTMRCVGAAVGDFRRSGHLDIVMAGSYNAELLHFHGTSDGFDLSDPKRILLDPDLKQYTPYKVRTADGWREFDNDPRAKKYREPRNLFTADFNNDGWLDIFVSEILGDHSYILWGGPNGFSLDNSQKIMTENAVYANAADFTGNGWLDLVVGSFYSTEADTGNLNYDSYITVYYGGPDGYSEYRKTQLPANAASSIAIADFNNDGNLDIFATSYHNGKSRDTDAFFYWGDENGTFDPARVTRILNHSGSGCVAADLNENGYIDLVVANHKTYGNHQGDSFVFQNGPNGIKQHDVLRLPANGPHGMMPVDPGNILDRSDEEYYVSGIRSFVEGVNLKAVSWEAELPPKTWVKLWIRTGNTEQELESEPFTGASREKLCFNIGDRIERPPCKYAQFKLALGSVNGAASPRISEVTIFYEPV